LRYVIAYIQTKNTFEHFQSGYREAEKDFEEAYQWSTSFPYSSAYDHLSLGRSDLPKRNIISETLVPNLWSPQEYQKYARDVIEGRAHMGTVDKNAFRGAFL
jgi:hypothetical protein